MHESFHHGKFCYIICQAECVFLVYMKLVWDGKIFFGSIHFVEIDHILATEIVMYICLKREKIVKIWNSIIPIRIVPLVYCIFTIRFRSCLLRKCSSDINSCKKFDRLFSWIIFTIWGIKPKWLLPSKNVKSLYRNTFFGR